MASGRSHSLTKEIVFFAGLTYNREKLNYEGNVLLCFLIKMSTAFIIDFLDQWLPTIPLGTTSASKGQMLKGPSLTLSVLHLSVIHNRSDKGA